MSYCVTMVTIVVETVGFIEVDDVKGICCHSNHPLYLKVEPLGMLCRIKVGVQRELVLIQAPVGESERE